MKALKGILYSLLALVLLLAIVLFVGFQFYLEPWLRDTVQAKGSAAIEGQVKVGGVSVSLFPLGLSLKSLDVDSPSKGLKLKADLARVRTNASLTSLAGAGPIGHVELVVERPEIDLQASSTSQTTDDSAAPQDPAAPALPAIPRDFSLDLKINDGRVVLHLPAKTESPTDVVLSKVSLSVESESVAAHAAAIKFSSDVELAKGEMKFAFPARLEAYVAIEGDLAKVSDVKGELFGVAFTSTLEQNLKLGGTRLKLLAKVDEISKLPSAPTFLPPGTWNGRIEVDVEASRPSAKDGWTAKGLIAATNVKGTSALSREGLSMKGPLSANLDLRFAVSPNPDKTMSIVAENLEAKADLTDVAIEKAGVFKKPAGVALTVDVAGNGDPNRRLKIDKFDLVFATLRLGVKGEVKLEEGQSSSLQIEVPRSSLAGLQAYFPALEDSPVRGSVQLSAKVSGDLKDPSKLLVDVEPLLLDQVQASVVWPRKTSPPKAASAGANASPSPSADPALAARAAEETSFEMSGPFSIDGSIRAQIAGKVVKRAEARLSADLSKASLRLKDSSPSRSKDGSQDSFSKRAGQRLSLNLNAIQTMVVRGKRATSPAASPGADQKLEFKNTRFELGTSSVVVTGQVTNLDRPLADVKIIPALNLGELKTFAPKMAANEKIKGLVGTLTGLVELSGIWDSQGGIEKSPLEVKGDLKIQIPKYALPRPPDDDKAPKPAPTPAGVQANEPVLPSWPVARTANVKTSIVIEELLYGETKIKGLKILSQLKAGALNGSVDVEKVFGGGVKVSTIETRLDRAQPETKLALTYSNVDMSEAAGFASKDWSALIKGSATGSANVSMPHPSLDDFKQKLVFQGSMDLKDAFISTLKLDRLVNEKIAALPGIGQKTALASKGVAANVLADYRLASGKVDLSRFVFTTPEKNELNLKGTLGLDKSIDLSGTAHLATAPVGGSVREANSDAAGRFVIPLQIKGNMLKPEADVAKAAIEAVLKKTAEHEAKKAIAQAKGKLQQEGQKQIQRLGDEFKNKGLDGLKGLFEKKK